MLIENSKRGKEELLKPRCWILVNKGWKSREGTSIPKINQIKRSNLWMREWIKISKERVTLTQKKDKKTKHLPQHLYDCNDSDWYHRALPSRIQMRWYFVDLIIKLMTSYQSTK